MDRTWLLIRRDFLKGTGLMLILPYTRRRKRRGTPIGLLLVLTRTAALMLIVLLPIPAQAHFKMHCKPETGVRYADPIVSSGVRGPTGHLHTFLANRTLPTLAEPNLATYAQMVGEPTTCQNAADSAAYWFPTMLRNGQPLPVFRFIAYYRSWQYAAEKKSKWETGTGNVPYAADTRMIAGDMMAPGGGPHVNWTCNQNSSRPGPWDDPIQAACNQATGTVYLGAHVDYPTCFSGTMNSHAGGMTADYSDSHTITQRYAYPTKNSSGVISCPPGFPVKVPALRLDITWNYQGSGTDLMVSSALTGGDRFGLHADFWNTWVQSGLQTAITRCVNTTTAHPHGSSTICGS
jgi:Domain of unknown function (DUF1996)